MVENRLKKCVTEPQITVPQINHCRPLVALHLFVASESQVGFHVPLSLFLLAHGFESGVRRRGDFGPDIVVVVILGQGLGGFGMLCF